MTDDLTFFEKGVIRSVLKDAFKKVNRQRDNGLKKWGDQYDPTQNDARRALLKSAYVKLGGDPESLE